MVQFEQDLGIVQSSIHKSIELLNYNNPFSSISSIEHFELLNKRKNFLEELKDTHSFRVAIGKSTWQNYESFNPDYNLREILPDEIVIEFDNEDRDLTWEAINFTAINLHNAGISFEIWDHEGKSPHLHIRNLPLDELNPEQRRTFKKVFVKKYVPKEYHEWIDMTLCGIHLVAIEWSNHWKGCYGVKKLINKWEATQ